MQQRTAPDHQALSKARAEANHGLWAGVIDRSRTAGRTMYAVYTWPMDAHPEASGFVTRGIVAWEVAE